MLLQKEGERSLVSINEFSTGAGRELTTSQLCRNGHPRHGSMVVDGEVYPYPNAFMAENACAIAAKAKGFFVWSLLAFFWRCCCWNPWLLKRCLQSFTPCSEAAPRHSSNLRGKPQNPLPCCRRPIMTPNVLVMGCHSEPEKE